LRSLETPHLNPLPFMKGRGGRSEHPERVWE
jgi:hypothetical protein